MEDPVKEQTPSSGVTANGAKSKLRYPLRSSVTKLKPDKSPPHNSTSAHKRSRATSSVSKSVNVLSLSAKDKSAKPPRRLSIPSKSTVTPHPKPSSNITPISETVVRRSLVIQGKSDTPVSDVSKSSAARRKFNVLSSASYWLSQIKLAASVSNHAVSLGFFKLAIDAGCEPLQRLRDELKSYVLKHNVIQLEETVKALFEIYGISETLEQMRASDSCSHEPEEETLSSIEVVQGSNSPVGARKLKFKSLDTEGGKFSSGKESFSKLNTSKPTAASKLHGSITRKSITPKLASENGTRKLTRKTEKASNGQDKNKHDKKSSGEALSKTAAIEEVEYENKENMDAAVVDEIRAT